jgi:hypothetical protein
MAGEAHLGSGEVEDDLERDPGTYEKVKHLVREITAREGAEGVEKFITDMVDRYI